MTKPASSKRAALRLRWPLGDETIDVESKRQWEAPSDQIPSGMIQILTSHARGDFNPESSTCLTMNAFASVT